MNNSDSVFLPHGGYENLRSYKVAEAVYDATVVFCNRFVEKSSRTHDQMVQAARSGVRNISEGSGAAATSRKSEMLLTNVARASLTDELFKDYLLKRQLENQSRAFLAKGGFTENLYAVRMEKRKSDVSDRSDPSDKTAPTCPTCGESMVLRKASKGANAGNSFWGCSAYPKCKGTCKV